MQLHNCTTTSATIVGGCRWRDSCCSASCWSVRVYILEAERAATAASVQTRGNDAKAAALCCCCRFRGRAAGTNWPTPPTATCRDSTKHQLTLVVRTGNPGGGGRVYQRPRPRTAASPRGTCLSGPTQLARGSDEPLCVRAQRLCLPNLTLLGVCSNGGITCTWRLGLPTQWMSTTPSS